MARGTAGRGSAGWWIVAILVAVALALWWMRGGRVPAPPPDVPQARAPSEEPTRGVTPHDDEGEEITAPEKQELERVLREHGGGTPAR